MAEVQTTGKLPIIGTAVTAWGDAFRAVSAMPVLVGIVFVILLVLGGVGLLVMKDPLELVGEQSPWLQAVTVFNTVVQSVLIAPLAIAVHRMVLLGEATDRYDLNLSSSRTKRFIGFGILVSVLWHVPIIISGFTQHGSGALSAVTGLVTFVLLIVLAIVTLRRLILFPAIAVDAPGASWRNARNDTKGHTWRVFFIFVCTILPMFVAIVLLTSLALEESKLGQTGKIIFVALGPVLQIGAVSVLAAAASRLFKVYGSRLNDPRGGAAAPVTAPAV